MLVARSPPTHLLAKFDHTGGKAVARLRQSLDRPPRNVVLAGHDVDGHLVAQVSQLQSQVAAAIHPGYRLLLGRGFFQCTTLCPAICQRCLGLRGRRDTCRRLIMAGLTPRKPSARWPLSSSLSISLRNIFQLMRPMLSCTGVKV